jgi:hypothetical protein
VEQTNITGQYLKNNNEKYYLLNQTEPKQIQIAQPEELRLLSVNEVRKILGIRHETVKRLISESKIQAIKIHNRIKIPMSSLIKYEESAIKEFKTNNTYHNTKSNEEEIIQAIIQRNLI